MQQNGPASLSLARELPLSKLLPREREREGAPAHDVARYVCVHFFVTLELVFRNFILVAHGNEISKKKSQKSF